jgi:predicted SAM-dependent methyltransferase
MRQQFLQTAYQILLQLIDVAGNISTLQSFARVAIELKEYSHALYTIEYITKMLSRGEQMDLSEPFISVNENFEIQDPGSELGEWVAGAVLEQIKQLQEFMAINEEQNNIKDKEKVNGSNKARRLHIGGKHAHPEWEIINAIATPEVDHIGNAKDLSRFDDVTFSELYASHVLEHFDYSQELVAVLKEWNRVLKPGGKLYISVPDLDVLAELILKKDKLDLNQRFHVMRMMFGGQIDEYDYHKVGLNFEFLNNYLIEAGYTNIQKVDEFKIFNDTSSYKPYGVFISLNVIAEKQS